jgi:pimeloyl-ACP methyl ester carboxylesterase
MNVILIHGSWHGAWCWHKVTPLLEKIGHRVHAIDLPGHGKDWRFARGRITLGMMAGSVAKVVAASDSPSMLVVHSRSGIVASTVAEMLPGRLSSIVYLASFMIPNGARAADIFASDKDSYIRKYVRINRFNATDKLEQKAFREGLYADCSDADVALANALLTPEPSLPALARLRLTPQRFGSVKRHYIRLTQDRAVSIQAQDRMLAAMPCSTVQSIEASHSAYFSKPDELSMAIQNVIVA